MSHRIASVTPYTTSVNMNLGVWLRSVMRARPAARIAKQLSADHLVGNAELGGTVQLWEWIGDGATTFSF